jgi:hypothetical protein
MSLFNKSYATSEQLELSRIAASSSPLRSDSQQQHSTSLLRSTRHIPPELRAPPYNPNEAIAEVQEETEDPFKQQSQGEEQITEDPLKDQTTISSRIQSSGAQRDAEEREKKRARTSQIGKMLFPPCELHTSLY